MLRAFVRERDWEKFHSPKNLVMALTGEVGELVELFQWLTPVECDKAMEQEPLATNIRDELADVVVYCLRLADVLNVDLSKAIRNKMTKNAAKYPVAQSRGHARKYTELNRTPKAAKTPKKPLKSSANKAKSKRK